VLNVSQDHLDRYNNMDEYANAKARIFDGNGIQVLNRDDPKTLVMARPERRVFSFGLNAPQAESEWGLVSQGNETWLASGTAKLMPISELQVTGLHNAANMLASFSLCSGLGLPHEPLVRAAREFKGLPHRVEKIAEIDGVGFFDDSKGTNVGATVAALTGMTQKVVLIAGGEGKGQDFTPLRQAVSGHGRAVVLIGRDAKKIGDTLSKSSIPICYADSMETAVQVGFEQSQKGDAVLLSPACASFDMFRNYQHRAQVFIESVFRLKGSLGKS
jgi:UDP-N-acetylmuramoylalanine--D-glutamate ligase